MVNEWRDEGCVGFGGEDCLVYREIKCDVDYFVFVGEGFIGL